MLEAWVTVAVIRELITGLRFSLSNFWYILEQSELIDSI